MKPNIRLIVMKSLLVTFCVGLFSFSAKRGGDSFEIWLNGKRMLQEFVHISKGVQTLQLTQVSGNDKLDVYYSHCGQTGNDRYITIKDEDNHALKVWKFADATGGDKAMSIRMKDILPLKKNKDSKLNLYYSSKELPQGRLLATLNTSTEGIAMK